MWERWVIIWNAIFFPDKLWCASLCGIKSAGLDDVFKFQVLCYVRNIHSWEKFIVWHEIQVFFFRFFLDLLLSAVFRNWDFFHFFSRKATNRFSSRLALCPCAGNSRDQGPCMFELSILVNLISLWGNFSKMGPKFTWTQRWTDQNLMGQSNL